MHVRHITYLFGYTQYCAMREKRISNIFTLNANASTRDPYYVANSVQHGDTRCECLYTRCAFRDRVGSKWW